MKKNPFSLSPQTTNQARKIDSESFVFPSPQTFNLIPEK